MIRIPLNTRTMDSGKIEEYKRRENNTTRQIRNNEKDELTINKLPDDCLSLIFSHLTIPDRMNFEKVCRRWAAVSNRSWNDMKSLTLTYPEYNRKKVEELLKRCGKFLIDVTTPCNSVTHCNLKYIGENCRQLKKLTLKCNPWAFRPPLKEHARRFAKSFRKLPQLESLVICNINTVQTTAELETLPTINLKRLKISGPPTTTAYGPLSGEMSRFNRIQRLSINYMMIGEVSLWRLNEFKNLIELNLSYCNIPRSAIEKIQHLKRLEVLQLAQGETVIFDSQIVAIVSACVNLKFLRLDGNAELTDNSFQEIASLPNLEVLHMNRLPLVTNQAIAKLNQLFVLTCDDCPRITADGLKTLIESSEKLQQISCRGTAADADVIYKYLDEIIGKRQRTYQMTLRHDAVDKITPNLDNTPFF